MIRYMLDTNACILVIGDKCEAQSRLMALNREEVAISQIVLHELEYGVCRSEQQAKNRAKLSAFVSFVQVLDFEKEQAAEAALIRCELAGRGKPIGPVDCLIAGHARSLKATLVTHNTREFKRVAGLSVEDWEK